MRTALCILGALAVGYLTAAFAFGDAMTWDLVLGVGVASIGIGVFVAELTR